MNNDPKMQDIKVLIVEDNEGLAELLSEEISDSGPRTRWTTRAEKALPLLRQWEPDLVISDLRLPGISGLEFLKQVKAMGMPPAFLIITAFGTVPQAVEALKAGADDFLTKPLDLQHLLHRIRRLIEIRRLQQELEGLRQAFTADTFHGMYGNSKPMRRLFAQIEQIAPASGPVLILGESGTGKELVARAIHGCSERKARPFLAINCAGIPETLMESEFFGHAAGAFTGAQGRREGIFMDAEGGTLLLDEIAEMPQSLQSKLLRILQDGRVRPLGSNREHQVDVRVLAATHQNVEEAVGDGRLRADLFYRLETFVLRVPPLRERDDDIELLANRFLLQFNSRMNKPIQGFSEAALDAIRNYGFPGNVRELRNAIERAVTFCTGTRIRPEHLPGRMRLGTRVPRIDSRNSSPCDTLFDGPGLPMLAEVERRYIAHVLQHTGGNKKQAADILGITRKTLYHRLRGQQGQEADNKRQEAPPSS